MEAAPGLEPGARKGVEVQILLSALGSYFADKAQLEEQLDPNEKVVGSNPIIRSCLPL